MTCYHIQISENFRVCTNKNYKHVGQPFVFSLFLSGYLRSLSNFLKSFFFIACKTNKTSEAKKNVPHWKTRFYYIW